MTLVLTEVSWLGVAMAADSAVTFGSGRVYIGAQKLLPVPNINAGISIWGRGTIGREDADIIEDADIWLQRFIKKQVHSNMGLWEMADMLATSLNNAFGRTISGRMGLHVAGFDSSNGICGPSFYHVHNGHYHIEGGTIVPDEDPPIREFRAHRDHPPANYSRNDQRKLTRNGDFSVFASLYDFLNPYIADIQNHTGLIFPYPESLASRGEYLRFWIKTITEIYRLSNKRQRILPQPVTAGDASIGGPVTVLTIYTGGIESFYTK